jgi:hypothetical protein
MYVKREVSLDLPRSQARISKKTPRGNTLLENLMKSKEFLVEGEFVCISNLAEKSRAGKAAFTAQRIDAEDSKVTSRDSSVHRMTFSKKQDCFGLGGARGEGFPPVEVGHSKG